MQLDFLGANRQVTGSQYCLSNNGHRVLIDCGMYQERRYLDRNWKPFSIPPSEIEAVCITHAHLDHCGLLPKLVREGFRGPIHTTAATADLVEIVLKDAAQIHMEDAEFKRKRHRKEGRRGPHPIAPLFDDHDVEKTLPLLDEIPYKRWLPLVSGIQVRFHDSGHILGSAMVEFEMESTQSPGEKRRLVFSGDLGQGNRPIIQDPSFISEADYLVMESTYGDRVHRESLEEDTLAALARCINDTVERGGNVIIPTFAIERAQDLIYQIGKLMARGEIPSIPVFLDSPMAIQVTKIFRRHRELFGDDAWNRIEAGETPLQFPGLKMVESRRESKKINQIKEPCVVMATSGMCISGRIKHHLTQNIRRPECMVLFVGYQAAGTLGRQILEGKREVRIHGRLWPVRARVEQLHGFSGHADMPAILRWLEHFQTPPKKLFLTHGEESVAKSLQQTIIDRFQWEVSVPEYRESVILQ